MRILLISGIYPPDIGGPATYIPQFAKFLNERNFEVSTIALRPIGYAGEKIGNWEEYFIPRYKNRFFRFAQSVMLIFKCGRNSDYIFSNGLFLETSIANLFLRKNSTAKIVGDPVWERYINRTRSKTPINEFNESKISGLLSLQRIAYNWAFSRFVHLTTPGEELARTIKAWRNGFSPRVIANGTKCLQLGNQKREIDVLSVSRLVQWKNVDILLEACSGLPLRIVVVGEGPERTKLEADAWGLDLNVEFVGQLPRDEIINLMSKSKVFALLSDYEGLSIALVEAMMSGCRVLVSDIEANRSVVLNQVLGTVINHRDTKEVRNAILNLCSDSDENILMARRAHAEAVKTYCEEGQLNKMQELLVS
jgi:glycosyltransferase involved in cell wall biosynthesis